MKSFHHGRQNRVRRSQTTGREIGIVATTGMPSPNVPRKATLLYPNALSKPNTVTVFRKRNSEMALRPWETMPSR